MSKQIGAYCKKCDKFTVHKVYDFFGREWYECTICASARDASSPIGFFRQVDPYDREDHES